MTTPIVSTIMPVRNGEKYIQQSLSSILCQRNVALECIVIDDGSEDETVSIVESFNDPRIKLLKHQKSKGVAACLNEGVDFSAGQYIARMDCDDIALPSRFEKQVSRFHKDRDAGICGSRVEFIGEWTGRDRMPFVCSKDLHAYILFANPFPHPSVMMDRFKINKYALRYDNTFTVAQDYDLWERARHVVKFVKVPDVLLQYRMHKRNVTTQRKNESLKLVSQVYKRVLGGIGIVPTQKELELHHLVAIRSRLETLSQLQGAEMWLLRIWKAAQVNDVFDGPAIEKVLGYFWFELSRNAGEMGIAAFRLYRNSRLRLWYRPEPKDFWIFLFSCLRHQPLINNS